MRAIFVVIALSLPALAQTSKPSQPAEKAALEDKAKGADAAKKLIEALQAANPTQQPLQVMRQDALRQALATRFAREVVDKAVAAQRADAFKHALLLGIAGAEPAKPSPLLQGDYAAAMQALDAARAKMLAAEDADAAFAALDEATKALMDARSALWKQKEAAKQPTTAKPAKSKDG